MSGELNILVVEDNEQVRNLMIGALQEAGHKASGTGSARRALFMLREMWFDVVFLDLLLPDGTGLDVVMGTADLPIIPLIIIVTGDPKHELIEEIRGRMPHVTVLVKPARLKSIRNLTERISARKGRQDVHATKHGSDK